MPKLLKSLPKYRHHRSSGQAVVTIQGKDYYLGPWQSKASKAEYDRLIGEWLAAGRPSALVPESEQLTVAELIAAYWRHAKQYYVKNGKPTGTADNLKPILRLLRRTYGHVHVADFGPLALKRIRSELVDQNHSRKYVNMNLARIRQMFKWGAGEELVPLEVYQRIATVPDLRKGRGEARESEPIRPVPDATVYATMPNMSPVVADMIRFQRLTGCRPGEVCSIRPCDVDTAGDVWRYEPDSHKVEHHDRDRVIFIGPQAQDILRPYLLRESSAYCFSPAESERKRRAEIHENRQTPLSCGNCPGSNRRRRPKRKPSDRYTNNSYRRAIHRACDLAFPPPSPLAKRDKETAVAWSRRLTHSQRKELKAWQNEHRWSPNQLRHSAATKIRKKYGLEAAQVTLGHANADVSQIYAERDLAKAEQIMREVG